MQGLKHTDQTVETIAKLVVERLREMQTYMVPVGVSNRHIHLSQADLEILYGPGYHLTPIKELGQPGQFAAKETVTLIGPKGSFENVRILGPVRSNSQVEISLSDSFRLGVKAPIRESGQLENTPGLQLCGPVGTLELSYGAIVALRHIHATPEIAERMGVSDKEIVEVETCGERRCVLGNVLVRVSEQYALEIHLDTDEANACGLKNNDYVLIRKCR